MDHDSDQCIMAVMADDSGMTVADLAEKYNVGNGTIRHWSALYDIPSEKRGRANVYLEEGQEMFEFIVEKKDKGLSDKEIAKLLGDKSEGSSHDSHGTPSTVDLQAMINETVTRAIAEQTHLAQAYGAAQNQIGRLEERVGNLVHQLEQKDEQLKLLPAQVESLEQEKLEVIEKVGELEAQVSAMADEKTVMAAAKSELEKNLESLEQSSAKQSEQLQNAMAEKESELERLKRELQEQQAQREAAEAKNAELTAQKEQVEQELQEEKSRGLFSRMFSKK